MIEIRCEKCGNVMELTDTDSRQEWVEEFYECQDCHTFATHRTEFNQIGLVTNDEIIEENER